MTDPISSAVENVPGITFPAPRRPRRQRRYPDSHPRARIAAWLRSVADWLNPLPKVTP